MSGAGDGWGPWTPVDEDTVDQSVPTLRQYVPLPPSEPATMPRPAVPTPWVGTAAPPARQGVSATAAIIGAVIIAGSSFAAGWLLRPPRPSAVVPFGVPHPSLPAATATATAAARVAPAPTAPSVATADVDIDNVLPADESDADLSKLLSYQGYLIVRSRGDAQVFVNGVDIGHTNRLLVSRCYRKHVRLRDPGSERWLTEGQPVDIVCGSTTKVRIDP